MKYTVSELISRLKQFPKDLEVQLDVEGALYDEIEVEAGQSKLIIFSSGSPSM